MMKVIRRSNLCSSLFLVSFHLTIRLSVENSVSQWFDYIEIGTSDFENMILDSSDPTTIGASVDIMSEYLDALPNVEGKYKLNFGIDLDEGWQTVYYIAPRDVARFKLGVGMKGASSIGQPHGWAMSVLRKRKLTHLLKRKSVQVVTFSTLTKVLNATKVFYLKVDAEAQTLRIIHSVVDCCRTRKICPRVIQYETWSNSGARVHGIQNWTEQLENLDIALRDIGYHKLCTVRGRNTDQVYTRF